MVATVTYEDVDGDSVKVINVAWTSDDTAGTFTADTVKISGTLLHAVTDPGATAPTADYDITITDPEGANVLANCFDDLVDRHTSNTERVDFFLGATTTGGGRPTVSDILTIAGTGCGNSKTGQVRIYWTPGVVA
jgi:hypothetical protein